MNEEQSAVVNVKNSKRFTYVKYDQESIQKQETFKKMFEAIE